MLRDCFIFISNAYFNFCFHCKAQVEREPFCDNDVLKTFQSHLFYKEPNEKVLDLFEFGAPRIDDSLNNDEYLSKCFDVDEPDINEDGTCNSMQQILTVLFETSEQAELLTQFLQDLRGLYSLKDVNSIITCYFQ